MAQPYSNIEDLKSAIIQAAKLWYVRGLERFPQEQYELDIRFSKEGRVAGCAGTQGIHSDPDNRKIRLNGRHSLNFNIGLAWENQEEFLKQTVPHEIAHLIADTFFKEVYPQGVEHSDFWRAVMVKLGVRPDRCHTYHVTESSRQVSRNSKAQVADDI